MFGRAAEHFGPRTFASRAAYLSHTAVVDVVIVVVEVGPRQNVVRSQLYWSMDGRAAPRLINALIHVVKYPTSQCCFQLRRDFEDDKQQAVTRARNNLQREVERARKQTEEKSKEQYMDEMKKLHQKHQSELSLCKKKQWVCCVSQRINRLVMLRLGRAVDTDTSLFCMARPGLTTRPSLLHWLGTPFPRYDR